MLPDRAGPRHIGFPTAVTRSPASDPRPLRLPVLPCVRAPTL